MLDLEITKLDLKADTFGKIETRQCFQFEGMFYMKVYQQDDAGEYHHGLELSHGEIHDFEDHIVVEKVNSCMGIKY